MASPFRPEFEAALRLFARVSDAMEARGEPRPILVGGAAVEFYTGSAVSTGDFDICTPAQDVLDQEMLLAGFERPTGTGQLLRGWVHPDLKLGFEVVARTPMDGNFDRSTLLLVERLFPDGAFVVISVEDLIADRIGQWASGTAADRLEQARVLYRLHANIDKAYLARRISEETMGEHGLETLEGE